MKNEFIEKLKEFFKTRGQFGWYNWDEDSKEIGFEGRFQPEELTDWILKDYVVTPKAPQQT